MGTFNKLKFWEKNKKKISKLDKPMPPKDDLGLGDSTTNNKDLGIQGNLDRDPMGMSKEHEPLMPPLHQPKPIKQQPSNPEPHTELILSKLDAIKANIENLTLRMAKLETQIEKQIHKRSW